MLLPTSVQPIPRVTVIVDTSGSMDKRDLGLSLGLVGKVLNTFRIRDGIKVVCGDTQAVKATRVFDPRQVSLVGGGGTDMGEVIRNVAAQKPKPQLIVVCSDGYTPWCERLPVPVVACLTNEAKAKDVPDWIKTVVLTD
jgi:predicted metal-dependent peptidase